MPAVTTLHQDSETGSKPSYFRGHHWGCISIIEKMNNRFFSIPLIASVQEGLENIGHEDEGKSKTTWIVDMAIDVAKSYTATIKTSKGDIELALNSEHAPSTVNNFVFLANEGFYDGVAFHRVIPDFMVQGGTELAPMSTTEALGIALKYSARGNRAVLLRIISKNFMDRGSELTWLSAFPYEKEFLYPPTTYLRPLKSHPDFFTVGNCEFTIVDVECQLP